MKKVGKLIFIILIFVFSLMAQCYGATYYVDGGPLGNDTNSGISLDDPLKTIQAAINKCSSGANTIYIRGAYQLFDGTYSINSPIKVNISGSDDTNRIVLRGYSNERPTIDGPKSDTQHAIDLNGNYITLQQLKVQNATGTGIRSTYRRYLNVIDVHIYHNNTSWAHDGGLYHFGGDHHLVQNCVVWNNNGHGIKIGDGINNSTVDNCIIYGNGNYTGMNDTGSLRNHPMGISIPDAGGYNVVKNCTIYSNAFKGINVRSINGAGYNEIYNNIVYDNNHHGDWSYSDQGTYGEIGITAGPYTKVYRNTVYNGVQYGINVSDNNCTVHNNVIYNNGSYQLALQGNATNTLIYNNTIYGSSKNAAVQTWTGSSGTMKNNIVYRVGSGQAINKYGNWIWDYNQWYAPSGSIGLTPGSNGKIGDPVFTNIGDGNFTRTASSSYINLAEDLGVPFDVDRNGNQRQSTWDFGAYMFDTNGVPIVYLDTPKNLRILQ